MGWEKSKVKSKQSLPIGQKSKLQSKRQKFFLQGFSLVELMVVIAIIGVVSAVGVTSISSIQESSRDTQRTSDLSTLKVALQRFYADKHYYPNSLDLAANGALTNCTGDTGCTTVTKVYLNKTPSDPTAGTTTPYRYCARANSTSISNCTTAGQCHYYALCATLENPATTMTCTCDSPASGNYRVNPL